MKVIVVGGYPGSGKSTIMRGVISELEQEGHRFQLQKKGIISWMESDKIILLGSYLPDETFPGTDRFPMNVQPEAYKTFLEWKSSKSNKTIVFEGDRLFNEKMLLFLNENGFNVVLCIVFMARNLLEERRNQRSEQNASWRKGRETKVDRIAMVHPVHHHLQNSTKEEQEQSISELVQEINGTWKQEVKQSKIKGLWS